MIHNTMEAVIYVYIMHTHELSLNVCIPMLFWQRYI